MIVEIKFQNSLFSILFSDNFFPPELLWVAPELLSLNSLPRTRLPSTQKGDVYSFAIILEEIVVRGGPYESIKAYVNVHQILDRVAAHEFPAFRPFVAPDTTVCPPDLMDLMEKCWSDNPDERPTFANIRSEIAMMMKQEALKIFHFVSLN